MPVSVSASTSIPRRRVPPRGFLGLNAVNETRNPWPLQLDLGFLDPDTRFAATKVDRQHTGNVRIMETENRSMQVVSTLAVPASGGGVFVWMASPAKTCSLYNTRKLKLCAAVGALPRKDGCHLGGDVVFRDGVPRGPYRAGALFAAGMVGLGRSGGGL